MKNKKQLEQRTTVLEDEPKRKHRSLRADPELWRRVELLAEAARTSTRAVVEQCLMRALPELERFNGLRRD